VRSDLHRSREGVHEFEIGAFLDGGRVATEFDTITVVAGPRESAMHPFRFRRCRGALLAMLLVAAAPDAGALSIDTSDILGSGGERLGNALDLLGQGQPARAEAVARRAIAASASAAAHEILGAALALQDRVPEAIEALQR